MIKMNVLPQLVKTAVYPLQPRWSNDFSTSPRPYGSIASVDAGSAEYFTDGASFRLSTGDILFIPPGSTYFSQWDDAPAQMHALHFSLDRAHLSRGACNGRRYSVQRVDGSPRLSEDIRLACKENAPLLLLERFYRVCGTIWDRLESVECPKPDERVSFAADYIERHCTEALTVEELAALCHLSGSYFFSCFKRSMGVSPIEYKHRVLIMQAQRSLLENRDAGISEIAFSLGFESETYFRRVFKAVAGVSPREFRQNGAGI